MPKPISPDLQVTRELQARGIDETAGVYGEHKVRIGKNPPIRLDKIKSASVGFAGFKTATRIARGRQGVLEHSRGAVMALARGGSLDAKSALGALMALQASIQRLAALGQIGPEQRDNTLWAFASAVENLSNADLARVYQSFLAPEMEVLQAALRREADLSPVPGDALAARAMLYDLQALVLKEAGNRCLRAQILDMRQADPDNEELRLLALPGRLTEDYPGPAAAAAQQHAGDISAHNLRTLISVADQSSRVREASAFSERDRLEARSLPSVSLKEMGDVLRSAELTINMSADVLLGWLGGPSVIGSPDEPLSNIFHLDARGVRPKGESYLRLRDTTEKMLFPELEGHEVRPDERPVYGAMNVGKRSGGAVTGIAYGSAAVVLKPEVARRATYTVEDTFLCPPLAFTAERRQAFYALLETSGLPGGLVAELRDPQSAKRAALDAWFDELARLPEAQARHLEQKPHQLGLSDLHRDTFGAYVLRCFGDREAARARTANWDNLEALIPHMIDVDGNTLARAAERARQGGDGRCVLRGAQYIEAQIQGPIIPSRDIAEVRIDLGEVDEVSRQEAVQRAQAFTQATGIPVKFLRTGQDDTDTDALAAVAAQQTAFDSRHVDEGKLEELVSAWEQRPAEALRAYIDSHPALERGLAPGRLRLDGNALASIARSVRANVERERARGDILNFSAAGLLEEAVAGPLERALRVKADLLSELDKLEFDSPAQRQAFEAWVVSAKVLRTTEEMQAAYRGARAQAGLLRRMAGDPPLTAEAYVQALHEITLASTQDIAGLKSRIKGEWGPDDIMTQLDRFAFMGMALFKSGEPPATPEQLARLDERLNSPEVRALAAGLSAAADNDSFSELKGYGELNLLAAQLQRNLLHAARAAGRPFERPFPGTDLRLAYPGVRTVLLGINSELSSAFHGLHPPYAPFPAAAHPEKLPAD
ncbi:MAG: DUF3626 domain-containing protein, partial [Duodenibacillus sp.]|nr:DUF3626 domain-containing protein [Duodenibacillus sp.]